jgi:hypothetical protein
MTFPYWIQMLNRSLYFEYTGLAAPNVPSMDPFPFLIVLMLIVSLAGLFVFCTGKDVHQLSFLWLHKKMAMFTILSSFLVNLIKK